MRILTQTSSLLLTLLVGLVFAVSPVSAEELNCGNTIRVRSNDTCPVQCPAVNRVCTYPENPIICDRPITAPGVPVCPAGCPDLVTNSAGTFCTQADQNVGKASCGSFVNDASLCPSFCPSRGLVCTPTTNTTRLVCGQTLDPNSNDICPSDCPVQNGVCTRTSRQTSNDVNRNNTDTTFRDGVTDGVFSALNPLQESTGVTEDLSTPRGIISRMFVFGFPLAGFILFIMIIWGGFETLSGAANKKSLDAGRERITAAVFGFLMLFASYWIIQIIEFIFNVSIVQTAEYFTTVVNYFAG